MEVVVEEAGTTVEEVGTTVEEVGTTVEEEATTAVVTTSLSLCSTHSHGHRGAAMLDVCLRFSGRVVMLVMKRVDPQ
jgi:hypothetical protein